MVWFRILVDSHCSQESKPQMALSLLFQSHLHPCPAVSIFRRQWIPRLQLDSRFLSTCWCICFLCLQRLSFSVCGTPLWSNSKVTSPWRLHVLFQRVLFAPLAVSSYIFKHVSKIAPQGPHFHTYALGQKPCFLYLLVSSTLYRITTL